MRSPEASLVMVTATALDPPCASGVTVKAWSLSPQPDFSKQSGKPSAPTASMPGFLTRFSAATCTGCAVSDPVSRRSVASFVTRPGMGRAYPSNAEPHV
ncbi:hypothetical protein ACIBH1_27400 [Nonomuraea sp. NPDC050663]|uniref:hypothetical protein n=1 Tax=Nonomuraea sp. NPDC050663 TaxID=3364370 RepID=UPI0037958B30